MANGAVPERLGKMTLADTDLADDEDRSAFAEISTCCQIMHERAVQLRQPVEVELIKRLGGTEGGAALAQCELLLLASGDLILNQ